MSAKSVKSRKVVRRLHTFSRQKWRGFTLVEVLTVILIISLTAFFAIPAFISGVRKATFKNKVYSVVELLEQARSQALASELDIARKIAPGGYGVHLALKELPGSHGLVAAQTATLFIDDWNAKAKASVNLNYADVTNRVLPDGVFTMHSDEGDGNGMNNIQGDTIVKTITIDTPNYIVLNELTGRQTNNVARKASKNHSITVIFVPPFADTIILGNTGKSAVVLQELTAVFDLKIEGLTATLMLNRIATSPELIFGMNPNGGSKDSNGHDGDNGHDNKNDND